MTSQTLFLDTHIFLHYQPFNQIDWGNFLSVDDIKIIVPPITIRELNKHKELHPHKKIRQRAERTIRDFSSLQKSPPPNLLLDNVQVKFEYREPGIDFNDYQLNSTIQDDQLIASIIMYRDENPNEKILLATSDLGLTLFVKAQNFNIKTLEMPETYKLPAELDILQKRIKELELEIFELKNRTPLISLAFSNGRDFIEYQLPTPKDENSDVIKSQIEEIKRELPKFEFPDKTDTIETLENSSVQKGLQEALANLQSRDIIFQQISPDEYDRYNREIEEYYLDFERYLKNKTTIFNQRCRSIVLEIILENNGTAPANDIDVVLYFPDGFRVTTEDSYPIFPSKPSPPIKPTTRLELMLSRMSPLESIYYPNVNHYPDLPSFQPPSNVTPPDIKRTNSYDVSVHINTAKQHMNEDFDPLVIIFDSYEEARSFHIDYQLIAANIAEEVTGNLHVIIKKNLKI